MYRGRVFAAASGRRGGGGAPPAALWCPGFDWRFLRALGEAANHDRRWIMTRDIGVPRWSLLAVLRAEGLVLSSSRRREWQSSAVAGLEIHRGAGPLGFESLVLRQPFSERRKGRPDDRSPCERQAFSELEEEAKIARFRRRGGTRRDVSAAEAPRRPAQKARACDGRPRRDPREYGAGRFEPAGLAHFPAERTSPRA